MRCWSLGKDAGLIGYSAVAFFIVALAYGRSVVLFYYRVLVILIYCGCISFFSVVAV